MVAHRRMEIYVVYSSQRQRFGCYLHSSMTLSLSNTCQTNLFCPHVPKTVVSDRCANHYRLRCFCITLKPLDSRTDHSWPPFSRLQLIFLKFGPLIQQKHALSTHQCHMGSIIVHIWISFMFGQFTTQLCSSPLNAILCNLWILGFAPCMQVNSMEANHLFLGHVSGLTYRR
jgi:hypothetical protein